MSGERKGVLYVFIAAVLYSLGGLCIKLIPDWSGLALNAGRNGYRPGGLWDLLCGCPAQAPVQPVDLPGGLLRVRHQRAVCRGQ